MSNYLILHAIHNCELIKGCSSTTLSTLYDLSYYESFKRNEVIAKQDAPAEELLILASGQVGGYRRNEQGSNLLVAKVTTGGLVWRSILYPRLQSRGIAQSVRGCNHCKTPD
ncbi:cyclic nucleotide-binding domain-containing protein [Vibrio navarrensis]|uniref:cyclic nucleotide-binding domain-containing protein n=1 Tax=Vibrio navarrensis TaxID=29495 RepID=UPI00186A1A6E